MRRNHKLPRKEPGLGTAATQIVCSRVSRVFECCPAHRWAPQLHPSALPVTHSLPGGCQRPAHGVLTRAARTTSVSCPVLPALVTQPDLAKNSASCFNYFQKKKKQTHPNSFHAPPSAPGHHQEVATLLCLLAASVQGRGIRAHLPPSPSSSRAPVCHQSKRQRWLPNIFFHCWISKPSAFVLVPFHLFM